MIPQIDDVGGAYPRHYIRRCGDYTLPDRSVQDRLSNQEYQTGLEVRSDTDAAGLKYHLRRLALLY